MRAVQERIPSNSASTTDRVLFHRPVGRPVEEFQAIACSDDEGITLPGAVRDVPPSDAAWCPSCRAAAKT
ncbi:hypothetical protein PV382_23930 [Streptomyces scabiei]|uniref:hypothetical protein n=1 Tax=Streptomyces scabiei TaxID=1930 RepID=UPI000765CABF|nr:hypothetical protein [Streptomyces scabiei]MDX2998142.1 hypothetical protein [Streptomyces scabiei]MDX3050833.1 hypothetical protein [Streptomyces scabiei]MDX3175302.1 hypothetical protein [Streptomyces scabiei]